MPEALDLHDGQPEREWIQKESGEREGCGPVRGSRVDAVLDDGVASGTARDRTIPYCGDLVDQTAAVAGPEMMCRGLFRHRGHDTRLRLTRFGYRLKS